MCPLHLHFISQLIGGLLRLPVFSAHSGWCLVFPTNCLIIGFLVRLFLYITDGPAVWRRRSWKRGQQSHPTWLRGGEGKEEAGAACTSSAWPPPNKEMQMCPLSLSLSLSLSLTHTHHTHTHAHEGSPSVGWWWRAMVFDWILTSSQSRTTHTHHCVFIILDILT